MRFKAFILEKHLFSTPHFARKEFKRKSKRKKNAYYIYKDYIELRKYSESKDFLYSDDLENLDSILEEKYDKIKSITTISFKFYLKIIFFFNFFLKKFNKVVNF